MPRRRFPLKTWCTDFLIFIGLFAIVGHLSVNFWERCTIQAELNQMRSGLVYLKGAINDINYACDNMNENIKDRAPVRPDTILMYTQTQSGYKILKNESTSDRRSLQDHEIQALIEPLQDMKFVQVKTIHLMDKSNQRNIQTLEKATALDKNVSTLTRYPLKSQATGSNSKNNTYNQIYNIYNYAEDDFLCNHKNEDQCPCDHDNNKDVDYLWRQWRF